MVSCVSTTGALHRFPVRSRSAFDVLEIVWNVVGEVRRCSVRAMPIAEATDVDGRCSGTRRTAGDSTAQARSAGVA
jgi:hypothetical protein